MDSDIDVESLSSFNDDDDFVVKSVFKKKRLLLSSSPISKLDTPTLRKGITEIKLTSSSSNTSSENSSNKGLEQNVSSTNLTSKSNSEQNSDQLDDEGIDLNEEVDDVEPESIAYPSIDPNPTSLDGLTEKQLWVNKMRFKFSKHTQFPTTYNMIDDLGFINQSYFRPNMTQLQKNLEQNLHDIEVAKWTDEHKHKLIKGISEFGIGNFKLISDKYLKDWSVNDLRLKTIRLIGRQNLQLYKNWKGDQQAIEKEYQFNKELGLQFNTWKNNNLVYDDEGEVLKKLLIHHNLDA